MSLIPEELLYSADHEWVKIEGNVATCGISDHAQHSLTDIVFVELPESGRGVRQGEQVAVVESVKAASDVFSPVSGTVIAVNSELENAPELVNQDPYGKGWMFRIELAAQSGKENLMDAAAYRAQCGE
jgi:glycine cleavage system H protein